MSDPIQSVRIGECVRIQRCISARASCPAAKPSSRALAARVRNSSRRRARSAAISSSCCCRANSSRCGGKSKSCLDSSQRMNAMGCFGSITVLWSFDHSSSMSFRSCEVHPFDAASARTRLHPFAVCRRAQSGERRFQSHLEASKTPSIGGLERRPAVPLVAGREAARLSTSFFVSTSSLREEGDKKRPLRGWGAICT